MFLVVSNITANTQGRALAVNGKRNANPVI
jgi:hypothetical protein